VATEYRFSQPLLVRLLGALIAITGAVVLAVGLLVALTPVPGALLTGVVCLGVVTVVGAGLVLTRLKPVVRLDEAGYQVRLLRRPGVTRARWRDVEDAVTMQVAGQDCVVLRLRDGRTTTIPVRVLDVPADQIVADLATHLDRGHGYRRLPGARGRLPRSQS
jgi:hypothetical protein